ncbi:MAG: molybdate ABC transporter substrate-binding protein [Chloroflexi bacterium]|nr:MAG: molybdate ABC transporter substrate-binding protein [Chloroflexota bacterium]
MRRRAGLQWGWVVILVGLAPVLSACGGNDGATSSANPTANGIPPAGDLTVAAAADLQFAFVEIGAIFEENTGQKVIFSFGSTGNLATQIEEGAPFDVFAAANVSFVDGLVEKGRIIADSKELYAVGRIVVAGNKEAGVNPQTLEDLLDPAIEKVAIANPDHAPYGLAAKEALISAGIWDEIQPKLVFGENIRQTLQFIQTGNAEAGIVALSIAEVPEITYTLIDDALHNPLLQAMGVVTGTPHEQAARAFVAYVISDEGQAILAKYGFQSPNH